MANMGTPSNFAPNKPGTFQDLDVLGRCGEGHGMRIGKLADCPFAKGEVPKHGAPGSIAQRMEYPVHVRCSLFNHLV